MAKRWTFWVPLLLIAVGLVLVGVTLSTSGRSASSPPSPTQGAAVVTPGTTATLTPEPIVPTRTLTSSESAAPGPSGQTPTTVAPSRSPTPTPALTTSQTDAGSISAPDYAARPRWGVGVASGPITTYNTAPLRLGWYLDWNARPEPARPHGVDYVQMVRLKGGVLQPDAGVIATVAQANPGSLWLIGNEPDVKWQDNVEPETYARLYHQAYTALKRADKTARVAIGGVAQPTPLRIRYLEAVLEAYRQQFGAPMPIDVWNVHNFVLREERGSWGVGIPPGFSDQQGALYEIEDSDDMDLFRRQIVDFRRWMAERGYQNKPLIVSEYGILMPAEYGFPPERVADYLTGTFDFFATATDPSLGYPPDGYRLVQRWCWYSLDAPDTYYPTGRLFDSQTGEMTAIGQIWETYVSQDAP